MTFLAAGIEHGSIAATHYCAIFVTTARFSSSNSRDSAVDDEAICQKKQASLFCKHGALLLKTMIRPCCCCWFAKNQMALNSWV
jgi:hypothetical protein